jgi:hypothetical protein
MKNSIIILLIAICVFGADSLEKVQKRNQVANELYTYNKGISNLKILSNADFQNMPIEFKDNYLDYNDYRTDQTQRNLVIKNAIKTKLSLMIEEVYNSDFSIDEKTQYDLDIKKVRDGNK